MAEFDRWITLYFVGFFFADRENWQYLNAALKPKGIRHRRCGSNGRAQWRHVHCLLMENWFRKDRLNWFGFWVCSSVWFSAWMLFSFFVCCYFLSHAIMLLRISPSLYSLSLSLSVCLSLSLSLPPPSLSFSPLYFSHHFFIFSTLCTLGYQYHML